MNYGLYLSAAGVLANIDRQEVITNNLANSNTVGFKPDMVFMMQRLPERLESGAPIDPQWMLERLGGSPHASSTHIDLTQGSLAQTRNPLDVAIQGEGFFAVDAGNGEVRLTRDGQFALNADGGLVQASSGMPVLDASNRPIVLDRTAPVTIDGDGGIVQDDEVVATLQVTAPRAGADLIKTGGNLLRLPTNDPAARQPAGGKVIQHYLEQSGVEPITQLKNLIAAAKSVMSAAQMMQYQDNIMGQAVNTLGRVS